MEFSTTDDTDRDKSMKDSYESTKDSSEKKTKARKRTFGSLAVESADRIERKPEPDDSKAEAMPSRSLLSPEVSSNKFMESLEPAEKKVVASEILQDKADEAVESLQSAPPDSPEAAAAVATATFVAALEARQAAGQDIEEALQPAAEDALEALELTGEPEALAEVNPESEADVTAESTPEADPEAEVDPDDLATTTSPLYRRSSPSPTSSTTSPPPPPPPSRITPPPTGATHPPGGSFSGFPPLSPDMSGPTSADRVVTRTEYIEVPSRRRRRAELVVVGVGAYLFGRRRGRLNTEAQMKPIQEKLTQQVKELEQQIDAKDQQVRRLARQQAEAGTPNRALRQAGEQLRTTGTETRTEKTAIQPERMGALLIEKPATVERKLTDSQVLEAAAGIKVEGVSLREYFEAGRLDMQGLRRAVFEVNHGRSLEQLLPSLWVGAERQQAAQVEKQSVGAYPTSPGVVGGTALGSALDQSNPSTATPELRGKTALTTNAIQQQRPLAPAPNAKKPNTTLLVLTAIAIVIVSGLIWLVVK